MSIQFLCGSASLILVKRKWAFPCNNNSFNGSPPCFYFVRGHSKSERKVFQKTSKIFANFIVLIGEFKMSKNIPREYAVFPAGMDLRGHFELHSVPFCTND